MGMSGFSSRLCAGRPAQKGALQGTVHLALCKLDWIEEGRLFDGQLEAKVACCDSACSRRLVLGRCFLRPLSRHDAVRAPAPVPRAKVRCLLPVVMAVEAMPPGRTRAVGR